MCHKSHATYDTSYDRIKIKKQFNAQCDPIVFAQYLSFNSFAPSLRKSGLADIMSHFSIVRTCRAWYDISFSPSSFLNVDNLY